MPRVGVFQRLSNFLCVLLAMNHYQNLFVTKDTRKLGYLKLFLTARRLPSAIERVS